MKPLRREVSNIKREVQKERLGWMIGGGLASRMIKACGVAIGAIGILAFTAGTPWQLVAYALLVLCGAWIIFAFATAIWFLSKQQDRQHDKMARRWPSKEYWKN